MLALRDEAYALVQEAKLVEGRSVELKRSRLIELKEKHPRVKVNNFPAVVRLFEKIESEDAEAAKIVGIAKAGLVEVEAIADKARLLRLRSDELYAEARELDTRIVLGPTDEIPADIHPKLRRCCPFPKRLSCNYGESSTKKWERCEFMKYDRERSLWVCLSEN